MLAKLYDSSNSQKSCTGKIAARSSPRAQAFVLCRNFRYNTQCKSVLTICRSNLNSDNKRQVAGGLWGFFFFDDRFSFSSWNEVTEHRLPLLFVMLVTAVERLLIFSNIEHNEYLVFLTSWLLNIILLSTSFSFDTGLICMYALHKLYKYIIDLVDEESISCRSKRKRKWKKACRCCMWLNALALILFLYLMFLFDRRQSSNLANSL